MRRIWILLTLTLAWSGQALAGKSGRAELELRASGTSGTTAAVNVGDNIGVNLFILGNGESITGSAVFLEFDDKFIELVPAATLPNGTLRPFNAGRYLQGTVFRNSTLDDQIGNSNANRIPLFQLFYNEDIPGGFSGQQRAAVGDGILASFTVRVIRKPQSLTTAVRVVRTSPTGSETGYFNRGDPGNVYSFRNIRNLSITVQGVELTSPIPDLFLLPGQVDSSLDLDDYIDDSSNPDLTLTWTSSIPSPDSIQVGVNPTSHQVVVDPRIIQGTETTNFIGISQVSFTVTTAFGESASQAIQVVVDTPPAFVGSSRDTTVEIDEDRPTTVVFSAIDLDLGAQLAFSVLDSSANIFPFFDTQTVSGDTVKQQVRLTTKTNFNGEEVVLFEVKDQFGLADTLRALIRVAPINDPPEFIKDFPPIEIGTLGQQILNLPEFVRDVDDPFPVLQFTFSGVDSIAFDVSPGNARLTITALPPFSGVRTANVVVSDTSNAVAIQQIQVSVLPAEDPQPPQVIIPSLKVGVRAGAGASTTILDSLVTDQDTPIELLSWSSSSLSLARIDPAALDSRRLEVSSSPGSVGFVSATLTVTDPTLLADSLSVRIYASSPITGIPVTGGLPDLIIEAGKSDQLDLDNYYFDADHTDLEVVWSAFGQEQIAVDVDALTHLTTFQVPETASNEFEEIVFTVLDPDGNSASNTMRVDIVRPGTPVLDLSVIGGQYNVTLGQPDTLALTPLLRIGAPENIVWSALSRDPARVFTQVMTDQLFLIGVQLGSGQVVLTATDKTTGNNSVDSLVVNVVPEGRTDGPLMLEDIGPLNLTAERDTTIDLKTLVIVGNTRTIVWTVQPNPNVGVEIDSLKQVAILRPTPGFQGSAEAILFQARDVFSGQEAVSVATPVQVTGDFVVGGELLQILLINNPVRTNFFDVFIRSRRDLLSAPFLGFLFGEDPATNPTAIPVNEVDNVQNMWFGNMVLSNDLTGLVELSATGIAKSSRVALTDTLWLQIERAQVRSIFSITHGDVTVSLPQDGVTSTSVVALYIEPEVNRAGRSKPVLDGLTPVSEVYRVYAPWAEVKREGDIRFEQAGPSDPSIGIYRQDEATGKWQFAGSRRVGSQIEGAFSAFGRYRLFADAVAPVAGDLDVLEAEGALFISVKDIGSGVDSESVLLTVNGTPVDASFDPVHHRVVWTPRGAWDGVEQILRLRLTDLAGNETVWEGRIDLQTLVPARFQLGQNFPNPFNPETTIRFDVPGPADFRLVIYNLLGQEIRMLMAGRFESGRYTVSWDAKDDLGRQVAAGMYLYRLEARDVVLTRKMVLVK